VVDIEDVLNNLHRGERLAAEIQASDSARKAWVVVLAYKKHPLGKIAPDLGLRPWNYRARWLEIDTEYINEGFEVPNSATHTIQDVTLTGDAEGLERLLVEWLGNPARLTYPTHCGLPMI
jgi:hypothetical protein